MSSGSLGILCIRHSLQQVLLARISMCSISNQTKRKYQLVLFLHFTALVFVIGKVVVVKSFTRVSPGSHTNIQ